MFLESDRAWGGERVQSREEPDEYGIRHVHAIH